MMEALRMKDRDMAEKIYQIQNRLLLKDGYSEERVLQAMIDDMKKTTKVQRDIKVADIFDLTFVKRAGEDLKASGWNP